MILSLIAAIGKNNELGKDNKLLWSMPADMKHFKETTTGHAVIMGRKTFESFPNGPLPNRRNIVLTRDTEYKKEGIEIVHSLDEALALFSGVPDGWEDEVFVIGGGELYKQAIDRANRLYITRVDDTPDADVFFPEIGSTWKEVFREDHAADEKNPHPYSFVTYEK